MAVTNKLEDSTPTNTITFDALKSISEDISAENFNPQALPENEGCICVHLLQWFRVLKVEVQFKNDDTWPGSSDSAADKRIDFQNAILSGGDNNGLWDLTFNTEDSDPNGTEQTQTLTGRVKLLHRTFIGGEHVAKVDMEFEFWVCIE